ncbi:MAG: TfoX/Sxy family protein [Proteobacteria bacterium]|nr:TfoX/Sxy family protein [Pseudomonadota bacterium]
MAYDEGLAVRIRELLDGEPGLDEKKMFGGIGYLINGNMACGIYGDALIVRVGPDAYEEALSKPHAGEFDITGRAMKGWVLVAAPGISEDDDLSAWIRQGTVFASSLPAK